MRLPNLSAHTDTQQQVAASRQLLRAGGLKRYAAEYILKLIKRAIGNSMLKSVQWLVVFVSLVGCATLGAWETLTFPNMSGPIPGPLNVGNERPPVQRLCTQSYRSHPQCDYAFIDSAQRKVNIFEDLLVSIDGYAEHVADLKSWVRKADARSGLREEAKFPYRMHLLTISPAIVLVVPSQHSLSEFNTDPCRGTLLFGGCIQSQSFRGNLYYFQEAPAVTSGSFWFTPTEAKGVIHQLPDEKTTQISVEGAVLRLTRNNWGQTPILFS